MATAIVSDLHLTNSFGEDLLRDAGIRRTLLEQLAAADRVVLLGDVLELRELPLATALSRSRPFFEELGEAMAGRSVVLVPGNHDHRLAEPLLERLGLEGKPLELEQRGEPSDSATRQIAAWLGEAELQLAYPGIWLRDDVYATHGHYMDCHMRLPRLECIAAAASMRTLRPLPARPRPDDYEGVLRPIYGFSFGLAQGGVAQHASQPSKRAWQAIASRNGHGRRLRRAALRAAIPASVWGINRLFRADFDPDFSAAAISGSGIAAAAELSERLNVDAAHTITGHTHRGGPGEDEASWALDGGGQLHNTGSWVFASAFHHPGTPPGRYWPGTLTWLDESGPPQRVQLLRERSHAELRATVTRIATAAS